MTNIKADYSYTKVQTQILWSFRAVEFQDLDNGSPDVLPGLLFRESIFISISHDIDTLH